MKYPQIQGLEDEKFRRLTGVKGSTFEKMISILKEADMKKKSHLLKRLQTHEGIESHFIMPCDDLGLCDLISQKSLLKTFGLFNDSRFGYSIEEFSHPSELTSLDASIKR